MKQNAFRCLSLVFLMFALVPLPSHLIGMESVAVKSATLKQDEVPRTLDELASYYVSLCSRVSVHYHKKLIETSEEKLNQTTGILEEKKEIFFPHDNLLDVELACYLSRTHKKIGMSPLEQYLQEQDLRKVIGYPYKAVGLKWKDTQAKPLDDAMREKLHQLYAQKLRVCLGSWVVANAYYHQSLCFKKPVPEWELYMQKEGSKVDLYWLEQIIRKMKCSELTACSSKRFIYQSVFTYGYGPAYLWIRKEVKKELLERLSFDLRAEKGDN